jgi:glyoxylase-like metal-dependent hydrolase (beta-lactamase superfamily II)
MSKPKEIIRGLYQVPLGIMGQVANAYVWVTPRGPVLVDAGPPGAGDAIISALRTLDYGPDDLVALLATHGDFDHIGGLAAVKRWSGALVVAAQGDVDLIEGRVDHVTRFRRDSAVGRLSAAIAGIATRFMSMPEPVEVDVVLAPTSDATPGGLRPIPTPGHTPGHTSYFALEPGLLFVGDAMRNVRQLSQPPGLVTHDQAEARRSIQQLAMLSFDLACFGHGPPITHGADEKVRQLSRSLE